MEYTVILSPKTDGTIAVSVPLIPRWTAIANTRTEAISSARDALVNFFMRSEVLSIDIPDSRQEEPATGTPWEWFGAGQSDPSWDELFDDIERERDATKEG